MDYFQEAQATRGRQAVFFTAVNPIEDEKVVCRRERLHVIVFGKKTDLFLERASYCSKKPYFESVSKYSCIERFLVFVRSSGVPHTLAARVEKAVCMKTQDELYQKVRLTPRVPRIVLKSNSQQGQEVDREVREPQTQGIIPSGLETDAEDQHVQQRVAGITRRLEQHRELRTLRKFIQTTMS